MQMNDAAAKKTDVATNKTTVTFLGTAAAVPAPGHEAASFIINNRYLVDTGWNAPLTLRVHGLDPLAVEYLFLSHCHHDHYLGLPQLLFYRAMKVPRSGSGGTMPPLRVLGPAGNVERVVERAIAFLQPDIFPEIGAALNTAVDVVSLVPGGEPYETEAFHLSTSPTHHTVAGMCCRFTDKQTGIVIAWTGDTAPCPSLVDHVRGAALLIHDATFGVQPAPTHNPYLHSGAPDAARLALAAGAGQLALIHGPEAQQEAACASAQTLFPATFWPGDGEVIIF